MPVRPNAYSRQWFEFFHIKIAEARTIQETTFVGHCAPLPNFARIADVCCGMGRHARVLSSCGYAVTGIDCDEHAIVKARELAGGPDYMIADIREYQPEQNAFDAIIVMGQSFGHFDAQTNRAVLGRLTTGLRKGGRLILDLWNPEFFAAHQGQRELHTPGGVVGENKCIRDDRLLVHLEYPDGKREQFEWQLFTPQRMAALAHSLDLAVLLCCMDFVPAKPPSPANPRIQFLLERSYG